LPSFTAAVSIQVGFEPGRSGSVIEKQLRMSPRKSGSRYVFFCSGVPKSIRISMLPASGAWQLNA
jgi:hypothetical protein